MPVDVLVNVVDAPEQTEVDEEPSEPPKIKSRCGIEGLNLFSVDIGKNSAKDFGIHGK